MIHYLMLILPFNAQALHVCLVGVGILDHYNLAKEEGASEYKKMNKRTRKLPAREVYKIKV
jgi:hypothetical protein